MANTSILLAFERMWQHIVIALSNKPDTETVNTAIQDIQTAVDNKSQAQIITWDAND